MVVEKLITRAKNAKTRQAGDAGTVHARRQVSRLIKDRAVVSDLFSTIAEKVAERPGGYTRIVRLGQRKGDGAELAVIELVDFNTGQEPKEKAASTKKEKRGKKPKKAGKSTGEPKGEARTATADAEQKVAVKKKGASQGSDTQESP
jgi:large subunit ribosomal protein L17